MSMGKKLNGSLEKWGPELPEETSQDWGYMISGGGTTPLPPRDNRAARQNPQFNVNK